MNELPAKSGKIDHCPVEQDEVPPLKVKADMFAVSGLIS